MARNILVLCGSPRTGGNSETLADAFIEGAAAAGNHVDKVRASDMTIAGCTACYACVETGECSIDDDFEQLVPLLCAADVVVFASPLYWYSFTAQLKTVIDRMFAVAVSKKLKAGLGTVLLGACGDETVSSFDGMRRSYEIMVDFCKWEDLGQVYATGVYDLGAIAGHEALGRARELGAGIG